MANRIMIMHDGLEVITRVISISLNLKEKSMEMMI